METVATIGWITIIILMIFFTIKVIINTFSAEKRRKSFSSVMKPGDKVTVPVMDRYEGEVLEVNGDQVKIVVTAHKSRVYPSL